MLPMVGQLRDLMPKTVKDAPCHESFSRTALDDLPILTCWPEDGGCITFRCSQGSNQANATSLIAAGVRQPRPGHWQRHRRRAAPPGYDASGGASRWRSRWGRTGVAMLRDRADAQAGRTAAGRLLARRRIEIVKCVTVDAGPRQPQIVLEECVDPGERRREGPFGDHTGVFPA
jgi:4-hydroxy-3-polyprenylbenzoate decarboxylase